MVHHQLPSRSPLQQLTHSVHGDMLKSLDTTWKERFDEIRVMIHSEQSDFDVTTYDCLDVVVWLTATFVLRSSIFSKGACPSPLVVMLLPCPLLLRAHRAGGNFELLDFNEVCILDLLFHVRSC